MKPVVLYDGECGLCTRAVARLRRLDSGGRLEFVPLQAQKVKTSFPALKPDSLREEIHVVQPDGRVVAGAEAYRFFCNELPALRAFAPLWHLPGFPALAQAVYRWVACHRHRLGGSRRDDSVSRLS